jgi:hypothetical protein
MEVKRIIVNNRSDCSMSIAMQMAIRSLEVEVIGNSWAFKDFSISGIGTQDAKGYTVMIVNNKGSKRINIYNEP